MKVIYVAFVWSPVCCPTPSPGVEPRDYGHKVCLGAFMYEDAAMQRVEHYGKATRVEAPSWSRIGATCAVYEDEGQYVGYVEEIKLEQRCDDRRKS